MPRKTSTPSVNLGTSSCSPGSIPDSWSCSARLRLRPDRRLAISVSLPKNAILIDSPSLSGKASTYISRGGMGHYLHLRPGDVDDTAWMASLLRGFGGLLSNVSRVEPDVQYNVQRRDRADGIWTRFQCIVSKAWIRSAGVVAPGHITPRATTAMIDKTQDGIFVTVAL